MNRVVCFRQQSVSVKLNFGCTRLLNIVIVGRALSLNKKLTLKCESSNDLLIRQGCQLRIRHHRPSLSMPFSLELMTCIWSQDDS